MNDREERVVYAAESAVGFVRGLKDAPPRLTDAANRLAEAIKAVIAAAARQMHAGRTRHVPGRAVNRAKQVLLRKHLDPIVADLLEILAGLPGIEEELRLPRIKDSPERHLDAATHIHAVAEQYEQELIEQRSYGKDFMEEFEQAIESLHAAARFDVSSARASYTHATEDVKAEMARLRRAFDTLDTRVRAEYLDDPTTLGLWRHQSRVPAKLGRPKKRKAARKQTTAQQFPKLVAPEESAG